MASKDEYEPEGRYIKLLLDATPRASKNYQSAIAEFDGINKRVGQAVLVSPKINDTKWSAGLGLAGTAIAGAAALAQSSKN